MEPSPYTIDRYELLEELGRGGMAQVFRARDTRMQREVAVKLLPREYLHDANFKARFEREAQTIAALEHPAIVPIHDYGEHEGQPYLVMRFMAGGSLADLIRKGRMSVPESAAVLGRIADALDYAHQRGVVHRDLKPANVMFDQAGHAYLSDFGIARLADATVTLTKSGVFIGTPAYMSPEQIQGDLELDGRSDVYALGIILFEMLSGQQPYSADTPAKVMMKHVLDPVPRLRDLDPELLPDANRIIKRALAKDREERYAAASELARVVAELAGGAGAGAVDAAVPSARLDGADLPAARPSQPKMPLTARARPAQLLRSLPAVAWIALGVLALGTIGTGSALALGAFGRQTPTPVPTVVSSRESATRTPSPAPSLTPSLTPAPSHSPTSGPVWGTIEQDAACRTGPGTEYDVAGYLTQGQAALTFGVDPLGEWWWIQYPSGSLSCWVSGLLVSFAGGTPTLPVLTPGPTPTPTVRVTQAPPSGSGSSPSPTPTRTKTPPPPPPPPPNTECPEVFEPARPAARSLPKSAAHMAPIPECP